MQKQMLLGKTAIVTGASYGIGYAVAHLFAEEGANVVLTARGQEKLDQAVQEIKDKGYQATGVVADIGSLDDCKKVFETTIKEFGDLDILINNAGLGEQYAIDETEDEWMNYILNINVGGPIRYIREALKYFMPKNEGVIVTVSSVNGKRPICGATYTASKGAVDTLTKNVAMRLCETNIRCNAIAPGATETPAAAKWVDGTQPGGDTMLKYAAKYANIDLPQTKPIDQAYACLYLASEMGRCVKGQVLQVCNGAFL
ncbi:SDR family oxidoreductase [Desulfobulbus rhabdoformis]|uniref:SDR family NAD(P)-dependent oxidoreductase n=1 Tax=Desulfobulbus rhabdoformis TaxID=34032 RepID=UPI00196593A4|nr:SDR family oxidoreductase [Desulfobulbus rhabdoformis]MBM9614147.1 SDR family oxidoreductase [Desulfobulbus rhabdoformis]